MKKKWNILGGIMIMFFVFGMSPARVEASCATHIVDDVQVNRFSEEDPYEGLNKIQLQNFFSQENEDYYVYFYMIRCPPYCNLVKDEMVNFASSNSNVYLIDYADINNRPIVRYDWNATRNKYNKKIGTVDAEGNIIYMPGESEEKYQNVKNDFGKKMSFQFVTITAENITSFPGASVGDVYIDVQTPEINYGAIRTYEDLLIAGVPTLLHVQNGVIDGFYFDATEIAEFLNQSR